MSRTCYPRVMEPLLPDEWALLQSLMQRATVKIRREVESAAPDYRRTIVLSLANVEHLIACELAHARGEPCPVNGRRHS